MASEPVDIIQCLRQLQREIPQSELAFDDVPPPLSMPAGARVSVIIPTFNMGWCVAVAIESVFGQEFPGVQVIVVDDGSTDDTPQRLLPYADRVVVVCQPNLGLSAARNAGVKRASGEFLVFLDADDRLLPGKLRQQVDALQARPALAAVYSDGWFATPQGRLIGRISAGYPNGLFSEQGAAQLRSLLLHGQPPPVHCVMLRRSALRRSGLFDETFSAREDLEFWLRFCAVHAVGYVPGESVVYTVRADSMSRSSARMHSQSIRLYKQLRLDPQFMRLAARQRAAHLRAWALEVGVRHYGPWALDGKAVREFAREACELDPTNWRSRLLPWLLASGIGIRLLRALLRLLGLRRNLPTGGAGRRLA